MKRYEKMTKEEIMEQYECCVTGCKTCLVNAKNGDTYECYECITEIHTVLNEEIKTCPRCHTFKDESDFQEAWNDWKESDHDVYPAIASYMMEEVEQ